jgi:hypothetical protein
MEAGVLMAGRRAQPPAAVTVTSLAQTGDAQTDRVLWQAENAIQRLEEQSRDAQTRVTFAWTAGVAASPPTSGAHTQGEVVVVADPVAGGNLFWVCVESGTPGTWKSAGAIAP